MNVTYAGLSAGKIALSQISEVLQLHLGMDKAAAKRRAIELLEKVNIPEAARRIDDYPHQFSGGMRQRVMIAMMLAANPQLLIADEPTTALDVTISAQILDLVKRLKREVGMAVIWITHDLGVVAGMADRVMVMYGGQVAERAYVDELYYHPQHPYTIGLLGALPSLDASVNRRLVSIKGSPPDLFEVPRNCPFAFRCPNAFERCWEENPGLISVGFRHKLGCFYDVDHGRPRDVS